MANFPASMVSHDSSIAHVQNVVYYNRVAEENLKANLPFLSVMTRRKLPSKNGKTIRLFEYDVLSYNITPGSEGTSPAPIAVPSRTRDLTVAQYFDYVSVSDFLLDQAIDPMVENISEELGYRAGLTVNRLCVNAVDTEASADSTTLISLADAEYMSAAIARRAVMSLRARDVKPSDGEWFVGIIHPLAAYDLLSDNTNGGTIDILKHVDSGVNEMKSGIRGNRVLNLNGIRWVETTTTTTTADYPSSGDTAYHSYVFGKDAFFVASLGKTEVKGDKNFSLMVGRYNEPSPSNPVGVIAASIGYNFKFGIVKTTSATNRFRKIKGESSIT